MAVIFICESCRRKPAVGVGSIVVTHAEEGTFAVKDDDGAVATFHLCAECQPGYDTLDAWFETYSAGDKGEDE